MENRILIIGDELLGGDGEVASRCAEMLLCREPNRPMQFSIHAPILLSIPQLISRLASDVIGKKPGRIVMALGLRDLRHGRGEDVPRLYEELVRELVNKTTCQIHLETVPVDLFPEAPELVELLNSSVRSMPEVLGTRVTIFDFARHAENFKKKQAERGKFARSLYTEAGNPTSLWTTLHSMFLQDCILGEKEKRS